MARCPFDNVVLTEIEDNPWILYCSVGPHTFSSVGGVLSIVILVSNFGSATLMNDLSKADVTAAIWDETMITDRNIVKSMGKKLVDILKLKRTK